MTANGHMKQVLKSLKPAKKHKVMLLAQAAGIDVSDWKNYAGGKRRAAANPKYCYEWAFVEPGKVVVLNLWHVDMDVRGGRIVLDIPPRRSYTNLARVNRKAVWDTRSERLGLAIQAACRHGLPVRAIICEGKKRGWTRRTGKPSRVTARDLDGAYWAVTEYDAETGACTLTRGLRQRRLLKKPADVGVDRRRRRTTARTPFAPVSQPRSSKVDRLSALDLDQRRLAEVAEAVSGQGQGWVSSLAVRNAIADYGMRKAREWLAVNYPRHRVTDASSRRAFDYQCTCGKDQFFVEVKCTTTSGRSVYLSPNEVTLARRRNTKMVLLVVSDVVVRRQKDTASISGGIVRAIIEWKIADARLSPALYRYRLPV